MVDKSDPVDEVSSAGRLYEQIRDTIQEEQVETEDVPAMTPLPEAVEQLKQRQSRFRSNFDRVCGDKALQKMRMRSMSFQEPIKEVNEEYAAAHERVEWREARTLANHLEINREDRLPPFAPSYTAL